MDKAENKKLKYSVLYAEDDDAIRAGLHKILKVKFEKVFLAENGLEALEIYKKEKPDLVITDIVMPKMTGLEFAAEIKKITPDIQIILTTAHSDIKFFLDAIKCKISKFLIKPIDVDELLESVEEACAHIDMRKEIKKGEKLLSEYKKAVDAASIVSKTDKSGVITFANDEFCRISGYTRDELVGAPQNIVRHPNMPKEAFENMWSSILGGNVWNGLVENRAKNGESYWVEATIVPIMDENDEIVEFIGIRKDITELVLQEKELEKLKDRAMKESVDKAVKLNLKNIIELNPLPAFIIDEKDGVVEYNELFLSLFDSFADSQKIESIRSKKATLASLFLKEGLLKEYVESVIDWKDMLLGVDEDGEKLYLDDKNKSIFSPSLFECSQDGDKFWIVYLK